MKITFQSSLPRSGSTLFSNLLGQNPDFYVTPTSGLLDLLFSARYQFTNGEEFKAQDPELMNRAFSGFCKGGLEGYFQAITQKPFVLDKSRGWGVHYTFLNAFYPNPVIICMVRRPTEIISSMEKKYRSYKLNDPGIINHSEMINTTLEKRVDHWCSSPPVGLALERLQDILRQGLGKNILFIRYEDLCRQPQKEMDRVYNTLNLKSYIHDPKRVEQITVENDEIYGLYGDHKIKSSISPSVFDSESTLGPEICDWINKKYNWINQYFYSND
jgi:sulfotransferase